ncbi:hypothetical protein AAFF_G00408990 [Aldrovandia affinis]|uniref:Neurotransmitter-gated ion-channel ligand-binding domain-containing protein n=1 Tax=Aldrovandia affinis TaxID=143900 RepID=A0AAD7WKX1_9TELE|nr:hypothetical protein AAFF_G00408990 [Aldrovandia affinis]
MFTLWLLCSLALTDFRTFSQSTEVGFPEREKNEKTKVKTLGKVSSEVSPDKKCSYQDVINYLNLTKDNGVYTISRPVRDWRHPTVVHLDINLYAILTVIEKSQIFTSFIWLSVSWNNELISWDPSMFCGISKVSLPKEMLWRPDLIIYEMIEEEDKTTQSPYIYIYHDGTVTMDQDHIIASTCKMDMYKFPFDTQSCVMTFGSSLYSGQPQDPALPPQRITPRDP